MPDSGRSFLFESIATLCTTILVLLLCFRPITDSDYWHHLAFGKILSTAGIFPGLDLLGYNTADRPWVSSGWLPSWLLYHMFPAVVVGVAIMVAAQWSVHQLKNRAALLSGTLTALALAAAYPRFLPRPDVFSIALMVPLIMLLSSYERHPLALDREGWLRAALMPALFLLWANCHMLFVIGLFIAGLFVAWSLRPGATPRAHGKMLAAALVLSVAATLVNPYGWKVYWFILENARLHATGSRISELKPLWQVAGEPGGVALLLPLILWAAFAGWLIWNQRAHGKLTLWRVVTIAFLAALALWQRRQIGPAVFGISAIILTGQKGQPLPRLFLRKWSPAIPIGLTVIITLAAFAGRLPMVPSLFAGRQTNGVDCEWFPCEAVDFLKKNPPPEPLFNDLYTGSYLAYQLGPGTKVFIDGRLEVYNNGTYEDFFGPMEGRMTVKQLFDKYGIQSALLDWRTASQQPGHTAAVLSDDPAWQLCWFSDHYALFVRRGGGASPAAKAYARQHGYTSLNPLRPQAYMASLADPTRSADARDQAQRAIRENPASKLAQMAVRVSTGQ